MLDPDHGRGVDPGAPEGRPRKIIHIDMDAFFASVEQRDNPALRGKPVAVGGARERGVVAAASYEARKFGVHSAMPSVTAQRKCRHLVFVPPRFEVYKQVSAQIHEILAEYTPLVEPLSLDEAYLDVTENLKGIPYATQVAKEIRARIFETTGLTASAGVSFNKFLAKMASDQRKPNGMFVILPGMEAAFVEDLPVGKFYSIGEKTAERMNELGIFTGRDLRAKSLDFLNLHFGRSSGPWFHDICRGIDPRPVKPERIRKSIGAENTFHRDLLANDDLRAALGPLVDRVWEDCEAKQVRGRTVTLKVKFEDFHQITRQSKAGGFIEDKGAVLRVALDLLAGVLPVDKGVRLLGVSLSSLNNDLDPETPQLSLPL